MRALALMLALPPAPWRAEPAAELVTIATVEPEARVAAFDVEELDAAPGAELIVVGAAGELRAFGARSDKDGWRLVQRGALELPEPARCLVDVAPSGRTSAAGARVYDVLVAGPDGTSVVRYDDEAGAFAEPALLARRARFELRTGRPMLADVAQDVNGDGRFDVVLPSPDSCELWMRADDEGSLRRAATVDVDVTIASSRRPRELSASLWSSFSIPRLSTRDVNGDGRADLLVVQESRRGFHLQREDGTFAAEPDVEVDLSIFRDTTPQAELRPGRTLAVSDATHYEARDLDRDGVPDYVLAHRRKVWVFHGAPGTGPQFKEPSNVLKAADDVTALILAELDGDGYPDLLLFKVQVPSVASLIRALFSQWRIEVGAVGYKNLEGRSFDTSPAWRGEVALELPSILSIVKDPEALLDRFREVGKSFREAVEGDLDGDGVEDVALLAEDDTALEVWLGGGVGDAEDLIGDADALLREVFFEDKQTTWDIDRVLGWISSLAARRAERLTSGRAADARIELRAKDAFALEDVVAADLDGDGRDELILRYAGRREGSEEPRGDAFDVLGLR